MCGDTEVERHSCCTIANLMEMVELHSHLLEENGITPLIALAVSDDLNCKGEASRAIANLAANADIQQVLLRNGALSPMVEALEKEDVNCQRFAALCLANLATTVSSQVKVVQAGAIRPLVQLGKRFHPFPPALALFFCAPFAAIHTMICLRSLQLTILLFSPLSRLPACISTQLSTPRTSLRPADTLASVSPTFRRRSRTIPLSSRRAGLMRSSRSRIRPMPCPNSTLDAP